MAPDSLPVYYGGGVVRLVVGYTEKDPADVYHKNGRSIPSTAVNAQPWRGELDDVVTLAGFSVVPQDELRNGICGNYFDVRLEGSPLVHLSTGPEIGKTGRREIYLSLGASDYADEGEHVDNLVALLRCYIERY